jgi:cell fate regulator YaaT (PSP1 superfamily)
MPTVVGVRVRPTGKVLDFDAAGTAPDPGDVVIVSTERGEEVGEVAVAPAEVEDGDVKQKLKPVLRVANEKDLEILSELATRESDAMKRYRELVDEHGLDMKPVGVEALFDGRKIIFYFTAEERVDFRELVKDLASDFKVRIDMRQIGVRDEARMVGGLGHCGQQLCCVRFGGEFEPVSIRMAKAQDLPLNPLKISGLCGRLMCCLRYEYEAYKDFKGRSPKVGARIQTPRGEAKVIGVDAPRETVTIAMEDGRVTVPLSGMECVGCQSGKPCAVTAEALAAVEESALSERAAGVADAVGSSDRGTGSGGRSRSGGTGSGGKRRGGKRGGSGRDGQSKKQGGSGRDGRSDEKSEGGQGGRGGKGGSGKSRRRRGRGRGKGKGGQGQGQGQGQPKGGQGKSGSGKGGQGKASNQGGEPRPQGQGDGRRRRRRRRPQGGDGASRQDG